MGLDRQLGEDTTYGDTKLHTTRVLLAFRTGFPLHFAENYSVGLEILSCIAKLCNITREDREFAYMFFGLQDYTYPMSA